MYSSNEVRPPARRAIYLLRRKKSLNRALLALDARLDASVESEQSAFGHERNLLVRDRGRARVSRVGDCDRDFHIVGGFAEGFREFVAQVVRFRQFFRHCD